MIKVTFPDGTTELRCETSPCRHGDEYAPFFAGGLPSGAAARDYARVHNLARCARGTNVDLWRLDPSEPGEPLSGRWEVAYVETVDEQIARVEKERDAALALAKAAEELFVCAACGGRNRTENRITYEAPEETP